MSYYVVQMLDEESGTWMSVKNVNRVMGIIQLDSSEKLTFSEAEERRKNLATKNPQIMFKVTHITNESNG